MENEVRICYPTRTSADAFTYNANGCEKCPDHHICYRIYMKVVHGIDIDKKEKEEK